MRGGVYIPSRRGVEVYTQKGERLCDKGEGSKYLIGISRIISSSSMYFLFISSDATFERIPHVFVLPYNSFPNGPLIQHNSYGSACSPKT